MGLSAHGPGGDALNAAAAETVSLLALLGGWMARTSAGHPRRLLAQVFAVAVVTAPRPEEPGQGRPVCRRSRRVPGSAGLARVRSRRGHHSPAATSPFPAGTSPFPARSVNLRNPDTASDC